MTRSPKSAPIAIMLSAVLAFTALVTPAAASAAEEECGVGTGNLTVSGPSSLFGVVGVPLAPAQFTTDSSGPVTWRGDCATLPAGVTFDQATASYVGTPTATHEGPAYLLATDETGSAPHEASFTVLPASALSVTMTDAAGTPIDVTDLQRGTEFELRGAGMPSGTVAVASLDGEMIGGGDTHPDGGWFAISGVIPDDVAGGAHSITVNFEMPGGWQVYSTELTASVRVLSLSGPTVLTPVVGEAASYTFPASGTSGSVSYELLGTLPSGLVFNRTRGTISGTASAEAPSRALEIVATDARGSVTLDVSLSVLPAAVVTPTFGALMNPTVGIGPVFNDLVAKGQAPDVALATATTQTRPRSVSGTHVLVVVDPSTGKPGFTVVGSGSTGIQEAAASAPKSPTLVLGTENATRSRELEQIAATAQRDAIVAQLAAQKAEREAANQRAVEEAKKRAAEQFVQQNQLAKAAEAAKERQAAQRKAVEAEQQLKSQQLTAEQATLLANLALQKKLQLSTTPEAHPLPVGTAVKVEMHSTPVLIGSTVVGASGGFALAVSPPANLAPGLHHLVATYTLPDGSVHTSSMAVTALEPAALVPGGDGPAAATLPATGASVVPGLIMGGGLAALLAGVMLMLVTRRPSIRSR